MNKLIICGNGGLLRYAKEQTAHNSPRPIHSVIEDISNISSHSQLSNTDILLAVSWHETERWIRQLKAAGAKRIYRIPVFAMQYNLPIIKHGDTPFEYCAKVSENGSDL